MTKKKSWRYYCEHCKKSGCSASHISKHEKHCCRNPNRSCRLCGSTKRDFIALRVLLGLAGIDGLRTAVDGCPNCMLATIIQAKSRDPEDGYWEWDYKKALEEWWAIKNDEERIAEMRYA